MNIIMFVLFILIVIIAGGFTYIAEKRKQKEKDKERARLIKKWYEKGQDSIRRKNESGCCCIIDEEDGETIISVCGAHAQWLDDRIAEHDGKTKITGKFKKDDSNNRH